jgi:hypothetical protein
VNVESVGIVAPKPVVIDIPNSARESLAKIAEARGIHRRYASRLDQWGRGLTSDPILKGLLGEFALVFHLTSHGLRPYWSYIFHQEGDAGIDVECNGIKIQVKTGIIAIRKFDANKRLIQNTCDIACFATLAGRSVRLIGWTWIHNMDRIERSKYKHWNIVTHLRALEPMHRMVRLLKSHG